MFSNIEAKIFALACPDDRRILLCHHEATSWVPCSETAERLLNYFNNYCLAKAPPPVHPNGLGVDILQATLAARQNMISILEGSRQLATTVDTVSALREVGCLLPHDAFVVPIDPFESITEDNCCEKGPLREYHRIRDQRLPMKSSRAEEDEWRHCAIQEHYPW